MVSMKIVLDFIVFQLKFNRFFIPMIMLKIFSMFRKMIECQAIKKICIFLFFFSKWVKNKKFSYKSYYTTLWQVLGYSVPKLGHEFLLTWLHFYSFSKNFCFQGSEHWGWCTKCWNFWNWNKIAPSFGTRIFKDGHSALFEFSDKIRKSFFERFC